MGTGFSHAILVWKCDEGDAGVREEEGKGKEKEKIRKMKRTRKIIGKERKRKAPPRKEH